MGQASSSKRAAAALTPIPDPSFVLRNKPPADGSCPLMRLADVEMQLIMHGLEIKELIRLSRCNQRLQHASDAAFAWKHTLLHISSSNKLFRASPLPLLLQRAPLSVCWLFSANLDSDSQPGPAMMTILHSEPFVSANSMPLTCFE
jgi:hypothetical protein